MGGGSIVAQWFRLLLALPVFHDGITSLSPRGSTSGPSPY